MAGLVTQSCGCVYVVVEQLEEGEKEIAAGDRALFLSNKFTRGKFLTRLNGTFSSLRLSFVPEPSVRRCRVH